MHRPTGIALAARTAAATLAAAALVLAPVAAHAADDPTPTTEVAPAANDATASSPSDSDTTSTTGDPTASSPTSTSTSPTSTSSSSSTTSSSSSTHKAPSAAARARSLTARAESAAPLKSPGPSWTSGGANLRAGRHAVAAAGDADLSAHAWFLQNQLATGGHHLSTTYAGTAYADAGLTADAVLALDAAGTGQSEAAKATAWLEGDVATYMGGGGDEAYAGATAKLLVVANAQGVDPTDFGGVDLVETLLGLEQGDGQFKDRSAYGDFSNTIGQSLAIVGLLGAQLEPSDDDRAIDFLLDQQCADGGFRIAFDTSPCVSDNDATTYAIQALVAAELAGVGTEPDAKRDAATDRTDGDSGSGGTAAKADVTPRVTADAIDTAIDDAVSYLDGQVGRDGGVKGGSGAPTENANSTGLATQAFVAAGAEDSADVTATWLEAHAYGCDFPATLRGGFAYDATALATAASAGSKATVSDQDVRASTQALPGLAGVPLVAISSDGAAATAAALTCAKPTSPTSPPSTSSTSSATAAPVAATSSPTGALAYTGAQIWPLGLAALVLLLLGSAVVVLARRRGGAHA
ncbi:exported hypothetical protein [Nostocoides japonicum T1-X7]|uniref:LPXTG-motif cell wall anchor domain protein n=1 Tax=Nostocoides japonicum T1-X7 TaxID=1194083 RepID=A0A077LYI7_9MICO|nr:hypothetical protein [Tetrasphaera japonica]CCH77030.1 exported hypothetical protein [Tetrasphaera japonica T1-X7]